MFGGGGGQKGGGGIVRSLQNPRVNLSFPQDAGQLRLPVLGGLRPEDAGERF